MDKNENENVSWTYPTISNVNDNVIMAIIINPIDISNIFFSLFDFFRI